MKIILLVAFLGLLAGFGLGFAIGVEVGVQQFKINCI